MLITKALLLYKVLPVSTVLSGSGLALFLKLSPKQKNDFTFSKTSKPANAGIDAITNKHSDDSGILIKEFSPALSEEEGKQLGKELIPIKASSESEGLNFFNFLVKNGSANKTFDEIFTASLNKKKLTQALKGKLNPSLLLTFTFKVKSDFLDSSSTEDVHIDKTISFNHLIDLQTLLASNNTQLDSAFIKINDLELNFALKIKNFNNNNEVVIALINKKQGQEIMYSMVKQSGSDVSVNPLEQVYFQYFEAYLTHQQPITAKAIATPPLDVGVVPPIKPIVVEPSINEDDRLEQSAFITDKPETFITELKSAMNTDTSFNDGDSLTKRWLSPSFTLGGFEDEHNENLTSPHFYIKNGTDISNYKLYDDPRDSIGATLPESIFTTIASNPEEYGGYIADELAETKRNPKVTGEAWINCVTAKPARSLCEHKDRYLGIQKDLGKIEYLVEEKDLDTGPTTEKVIIRRSFDTITPTRKIGFDEPTPSHYLHPFIAKQLTTIEDQYKEVALKLPTFTTPITQAIVDQGSKPLNSKEYEALLPKKEAKDRNITFPAYFVRAAHFWETERDSQPKLPTPQNHYSTSHQFSMKIFLKDWQKYLLNNDDFGTADIPANTDKTLNVGLNISVPITAELQDGAFDAYIKKTFNLSTFINLESFKNSNEIVNVYPIINQDFNEYELNFKTAPPTDRMKFDGLDIKSNLIMRASLDSDYNMNITYEVKIDKFIQAVKTVCDFRDFDREETIKYFVHVLCPNYYKLPALFAVTIGELPTVAPYWYVNASSPEPMRDYLLTDKLPLRSITTAMTLENFDRQLKVIATLKPNKSKEEGAIEKKVTVITPGSWWSSTTKVDRYVTFFNVSVPQIVKETVKAKEKEPEKEVEKEIKPWEEDHWTTLEVATPTKGNLMILGIDSPDPSTLPLIINSKHPFSTTLSVWTNNSFGESIKPSKEKKGFDNQSYGEEELEKAPNEIFTKYANSIEFAIDPDAISNDEKKPTWIPIRLALNLNKDKKYSDIKEPLEEIFTYMLKEDGEMKDAGVKGAKADSSKITKWDKDDQALAALQDKKDSFSFVSYGLWAYKTVVGNKTTFKLKSKLWGASFTNQLNSSQAVKDHGAEGSAGMMFTSLKIIKPEPPIQKS